VPAPNYISAHTINGRKVHLTYLTHTQQGKSEQAYLWKIPPVQRKPF